ncbi:MAG TPA: hypothetical protein VHJ76_00360 [Actinomycetota bacterium]|nr:hypothetical protein [Actinomycetota bacterium]
MAEGRPVDAVMSIGSLAIAAAFYIAVWVEAVRLPPVVWEEADYRRGVWLVYLATIPLMWLPYLFLVRPKLLRTARRLTT